MSHLVDLRGFHYELEPLADRAQWQMDALQLSLAKAQQQLQESRSHLERLVSEKNATLLGMKELWGQRLDVTTYTHALRFIQNLQQLIERQQVEVAGTKEKVGDAMKACIKQQQKLELYATHRKEKVAEYSLELGNILSAEADRDWNARGFLRDLKSKQVGASK